MMDGEARLIINACVTLYGTFSMFLWLINAPDSSVNTAAACGLIIRRDSIICQDDWSGHVRLLLDTAAVCKL